LNGIHKVVVTIRLLPVTRASLPESNPIGDAINDTLIGQFIKIQLEGNSIANWVEYREQLLDVLDVAIDE